MVASKELRANDKAERGGLNVMKEPRETKDLHSDVKCSRPSKNKVNVAIQRRSSGSVLNAEN